MAISYRRIMNLEKIARLEAAGWRDPEIARQIGLSLAGLATAKQDPDFASVRDRIRTGVCSELDEQLKDDLLYQREKIRSMMPVALDGLLELAMQTKNERVRLTACSEIMDRDGRLAKVQRIGLPTEDQGGIGSVDDETADALIIALKTAKKVTDSIKPSIDSEPSTSKVQ